MSIRDDLLAVRDSLTATLDGCNAVLAVPAPDISCLPANKSDSSKPPTLFLSSLYLSSLYSSSLYSFPYCVSLNFIIKIAFELRR